MSTSLDIASGDVVEAGERASERREGGREGRERRWRAWSRRSSRSSHVIEDACNASGRLFAAGLIAVPEWMALAYALASLIPLADPPRSPSSLARIHPNHDPNLRGLQVGLHCAFSS